MFVQSLDQMTGIMVGVFESRQPTVIFHKLYFIACAKWIT